MTGHDPETWMSIARAEVGTAEVPGTANNPRIKEYHASTRGGALPDSVPWCSSFVNWVLARAGITGSRSKAARSWETWGWGPAVLWYGAVVVIYNPRARGTNLTRSGKHVGFYVESDAATITLLGGNQGNRVSVKRFSLAKWRVVAIRWPA